MQYKGLEITAFEETPGKWRARIVRANGKPLKGNHRKLLKALASTNQTLASTNLPSAVDALTLALEAVDAAGLFFAMAIGNAACIRLPGESADGDACPCKLVLTTSFENRKCPNSSVENFG